MILVGGENLIDFIQDAPDGGFPAYRAIPGGAPFNVAKAVARQGPAVGYMTPFSSDTLGQLLAADLGREANVTALHPASDKPTSLAVVSLKGGQAQYQFYRENTAERDVTAQSLRAILPPEARAFFVGSLAITDGADADAWEATMAHAHGAGLFTALDPNIRAPFIHDRAGYLERLSRLLQMADLVKLSDEDIAWIRPGEDPVEALKALAGEARAGFVVLTMGAEGAVGLVNGAEVRVPTAPVPDLKDTVGAGDTFMGTLLAQCAQRGLMTRDGLAGLTRDTAHEILTVAARAAAINCARKGCNPPTAAELVG